MACVEKAVKFGLGQSHFNPRRDRNLGRGDGVVDRASETTDSNADEGGCTRMHADNHSGTSPTHPGPRRTEADQRLSAFICIHPHCSYELNSLF
jgi:hypothetical protein